MNPKIWWYLSRSSGLVAWGLAGIAILLGLLLSGRLRRVPTPAWQQDLHRYVGGLSALFLALHLTGLALDPTVAFGPAALAVPMAAGWKPGAVAWGIGAAYALLAVELSSLVMRRLPRKLWRAIHFASYGVWVGGTVHALQAGTDQGATLVIAIVGSALIFNLTVLRIVGRRVPRARAASPRAAATRTPSPRPSPGG